MRRGFSLVELLAVIGIIAVVVGMVVTTSASSGRGESVELVAEGVASMLRRARAMAIADQASVTVSFNLENAPGSSGRIINNRTGGHWCRIMRAQRAMVGNNSGVGTDAPPILVGAAGQPQTGIANGAAAYWQFIRCPGAISGNNYLLPTFPHVIEEIKAVWVGDRFVLPAGKVRFLALGDSDEGPRLRCGPSKGYGYGTTYPRPYFGWYDPVAKRLYPWGGYDPDLPPVASYAAGWPTVTNYTGLFYQGPAEPAITDSRHPAARAVPVDWNGDGDTADTDPSRGPEGSYEVYAAGAPRPLVNGEWGDFTIVFEADGTANFPPMKCNRRFYRTDAGETFNFNGTNLVLGGGGVSDQAKAWSWFDSGGGGAASVPNGESIHYQRHTSRAFITLAPDIRSDDDRFDSARQALQSMLPMVRVWVNSSGMVGVTKVRVDDGWLAARQAAGKTLWPSSPSIYEMSSAADRQWIEQNFRYGWLHEVNTADSSYGALRPIGRPYIDVVSAEMMVRRIWWELP